MSCVRLATFNCRGVMGNSIYVTNIMDSCDIVCLQEHFLYPDYNDYLLTLHSEYTGIVRCENSLNVFDCPRRRKGGLAIMWRKSMNYTIEPMIDIGSDRILVIKISGVYCQPVYIINVYLPSANYPIAYYIQIIDELSYIYQLLSETGIVIIAGDI